MKYNKTDHTHSRYENKVGFDLAKLVLANKTKTNVSHLIYSTD